MAPGLGMLPSCEINCLTPDVQLYGSTKGDTTFENEIVLDSTFNNGNVEIRYDSYHSCERLNPADLIDAVSPDKFVLIPFYKNDIPKTDDLFKEGPMRLNTPSYGYPPIVSVNADTTKYVYERFHNSCDNFSKDKIAYIGIKIGLPIFQIFFENG